jgi:hypothetical protein
MLKFWELIEAKLFPSRTARRQVREAAQIAAREMIRSGMARDPQDSCQCAPAGLGSWADGWRPWWVLDPNSILCKPDNFAVEIWRRGEPRQIVFPEAIPPEANVYGLYWREFTGGMVL